jgi:transposase
MLVPSVPPSIKILHEIFDPELWIKHFRCEHTAFRGLAASCLIATCQLSVARVERIKRSELKDGALLVARRTGIRPIPLLPIAQQALRLQDSASNVAESEALFTSSRGHPIPRGNLLMQILRLGRQAGLAENLPTNLLAVFRDTIGDGPIAEYLRGRRAPAFSFEEQRAYLQSVHPMASMSLPAVVRPSLDTALGRALACKVRRKLDEQQREQVRLEDFAELHRAWRDHKLDAKRFAMYLGVDCVFRWVRRYEARGVDGLKQKTLSPNRYQAKILKLRAARGLAESQAAFRRFLAAKHGITVSESWLARLLDEAGLLGTRGAKAWNKKVVRIFHQQAPVTNAFAFWRMLRDQHGYPYTVSPVRKAIKNAGLRFETHRKNNNLKLEREKLIIKLYREHQPVKHLSVFLDTIREKHGVKIELRGLRDILHDAGLRQKQQMKIKSTNAARSASEKRAGTSVQSSNTFHN